MVTVNTMLRCFSCGKEKVEDDFYKNRTRPTGRSAECRECELPKKRAYMQRRRAADPEKERTFQRDYRRRRSLADPEWVKKQTKIKNQWAIDVDYEKTRRDRGKRNARRALQHAISVGSIMRQPCEVCGNDETHGHHDDYSRPLEVRWLCRTHHMELHRK